MPLSLLLFLGHAALAGTELWLVGEPAAVQTSGDTAVSVAAASPDLTWSPSDERAVGFLADELKAVRPLADIFDGELQIMLRLQTALGDISVLRPQDRDLVYAALLFQGFAVHRYFQDKLPTDPEAAPYRASVEDRMEVAAWVDAIALNPDAQPDAPLIPDTAELLAFQELRARVLLTPTAMLIADGLPDDGRLIVDGHEAATDRARVPTGLHRVELAVHGVIRARLDLRLAPATEQHVVLPATAAELRALAEPLRAHPDAIQLTPAVQAALQALTGPVQLVAMAGKVPVHYAVAGDTATRVEPASAFGEGSPWGLARASVGGGWFYDGSFFLENDGSQHDRGTVNAVAPTASLGLEIRPLRLLALGVGADLSLPLGKNHTLPTGTTTLRLRAYPHLAVGLPWMQATAGLLLPWRVGLGVRAHVPLPHGLELSGAYVYGKGLTIDRANGPEFQPPFAQSAWIGIGAHLDAR